MSQVIATGGRLADGNDEASAFGDDGLGYLTSRSLAVTASFAMVDASRTSRSFRPAMPSVSIHLVPQTISGAEAEGRPSTQPT